MKTYPKFSSYPYKKQVSNLQSYFFFSAGSLAAMFCMQIKHADAIMRIPLHFLRSAIKVSESRSPPWHVQSKSKPKTFDSILKFMSSTVKVTPRNERYRKVTNIFGRNCCSRLLTISHDLSYSLIAILLLYLPKTFLLRSWGLTF